MKKNVYVIFRLGAPSLLKLDVDAILHLASEDEDLVGTPIPFGLVSLFKTELSADDIKQRYLDTAKELDDHVPIIIWDLLSDSAAYDFRDFPNVIDMFNQFTEYHGINKNVINVVLDLDEILDKISRTGIDSLTDRELSLLKDASKE